MGLYETYFSEDACYSYIAFFIVTLIVGIFLLWQVYPKVTWTHWGSGRGALAALFIVISIIGILGVLMKNPGLVFFSMTILITLILIMIGAVAVAGVSELYPIRVDPTVVALTPNATPVAV